LLLAVVIIGCSTADGLPPSSHDTEPYEPPPPPPADSADSSGGDDDQEVTPEYGDNCGADVIGWQTSCDAQSTKREYTDPLEMTAVTVEDELDDDFAKLCCEGFATREEADGGCQELCMYQLCEEARQTHVWWALDVTPGCLAEESDDCGFDMAACLVGEPYMQVLDDPTDMLDPLEYFLDVDCNAENGSDRGVPGHWDWLEYPENAPENDPPMCYPPPELGDDPDSRRPQFALAEGPGTQATFSWAFGEAHGIETTQDLSVEAGYGLIPCDGGQRSCVELTGLAVSMPSMIVHGLSLGTHHLILEEIRANPFELSGDGFVVPNQALRFTMTGHVNGLPTFLTGYNDGPAYGRVSSSSLALRELQLGYRDDLFQASLRLDLSTTANASKPSASIRVLDAPASCGEAVLLDASSTDPDGEWLSHVWWYPPVGFSTGPVMTAAMAPGSHPVLLLARDSTGRSHATGIRYDRVCQ
jgi:hypothetical protein